MPNKSNKTNKRDIERAAIIKKTADIHKLSKRQIRRILACENENKEVLETFMFLSEGQNKLVEAAKQLVKF